MESPVPGLRPLKLCSAGGASACDEATVNMGSPRNTSKPSGDAWTCAVMESLRDVVWVHDVDGTVSYCSPAAGAVWAIRRQSCRTRTKSTSSIPSISPLVTRCSSSSLPRTSRSPRWIYGSGSVTAPTDGSRSPTAISWMIPPFTRSSTTARHQCAQGGRRGAHRPQHARPPHGPSEPHGADGQTRYCVGRVPARSNSIYSR